MTAAVSIALLNQGTFVRHKILVLLVQMFVDATLE